MDQNEVFALLKASIAQLRAAAEEGSTDDEISAAHDLAGQVEQWIDSSPKQAEYRLVNGQHLVPIQAYRLGQDYLLTKSPGYQWHVCHVTGNGEGTRLVLALVGTWYELTDAVQGALADRQSRS